MLWQDGVKTLYDPCPPGWRVPQSGEGIQNPWKNFTGDNSAYGAGADGGRKWKDPAIYNSAQTWYPCSGVRSQQSSGNIFPAVGNTGYYWTASTLLTRGNRLRFDSQSVLSGASTSDVRSDAYPVRCIRE